MTAIADITAREILDSRGNPTIEVDVILENDAYGRAGVPSGASIGTYEAIELRDREPERFMGKGVQRAVAAVRGEIRDAILGFEVEEQAHLDATLAQLDGRPDKSRLGANALLGVSLAAAKAAACAHHLPLYRYLGGPLARVLPVPLVNILNGGAHADNDLDIQEFMIMPLGASNFAEAVRWVAEIYHHLRDVLVKNGYSTNVGDEGGVAPSFHHAKEALDALMRACEAAGRQPGEEIVFALDVAANELQKEKGCYEFTGSKTCYDAQAMIAWYQELTSLYPIVSIEDGLSEDDWGGWCALTHALGNRIQIVGDDLFVTHPKRLARGIAESAGNAILIKPNQIGSLSETLETIDQARRAGWRVILSHRSGETEDNSIADLAVATGCGQIKAGAVARGERVTKYNALLRIEEELGSSAVYAGGSSSHLRSLDLSASKLINM